MKTAIISSNTSHHHLTGDGHPEQPKRVIVIKEKLKKNKNLIWDKPIKFDQNIINNVHKGEYINTIQNSFPNKGFNFLDGDTIVSPGSKDATIDAVGSVIKAIEGVEQKKFKNAFCPVRPPGHHAEKNKAMGFCIYNNCAVGAQYLIEKFNYKRVAIFDPDVHHGNGTQDIFYDNKNILYLSTHQYPFYPGTGSDKEKGNHNNIFNVPLPAGTNSENYFNALNKILDKLISFKPEFLIFSMGFDANIADPLAQFELKSEDFYEITRRTLKATNKFTNGRVISVLEGGYDLNALAESAFNHVKALCESD